MRNIFVHEASEISSESGINIKAYKTVVRRSKMMHKEATRHKTQKLAIVI